MPHLVKKIQHRLADLGDATDAAFLQGFFKTGPGQYGHGDRFRGIRVPVLRKLAREFAAATSDDALQLLQSKWHEDRVLALLLWLDQFARGDEPCRHALYRLYLANTARINNWDLVDISAPGIVGAYLADKDRAPLCELARSASLWERRIAILACLAFIRQGDFTDILRLSAQLLADPHDLIHKAVGWMLREVGKRDRCALEAFLRAHYRKMPRTMLRYAIEKFPPSTRQAYLKGRI